MKILYFSPNFKNYTASYYQINTINSLKKKNDVILWGPGFHDYDANINLEDILKKKKISEKDIICIGHGWLSDIDLNYDSNVNNKHINRYSWLKKNISSNPKNKLEFCGSLDFYKFKGKKICILNKEYVNLNHKLEFIKRNKFNLVLSHNPHYKEYEKYCLTNVKFWPHATSFYPLLDLKKKNDIYFSGILQNPFIKNKNKKNIIIKIQKKIFFNLFNIFLLKKIKFLKYSFIWNAYTGNRVVDKIRKILGLYSMQNFEDHFSNYRSSRAVICTLSPADIISPRYFEAMISGSICLCEESNLYREIFKPYVHYIPFNKNLGDFAEKLEFACSDSKEIENIKQKAYDLVSVDHTYDARADQLINYIHEI